MGISLDKREYSSMRCVLEVKRRAQREREMWLLTSMGDEEGEGEFRVSE